MLNTAKGWLGEKMTTVGLWAFFSDKVYHRVDNVIVPTANGTTQIDHLLVSVYGIFVIETKNIKGWIYGSPEQDKWTQVLFGDEAKFGNPLKQNYRHTRCLSEYLGLDHGVFRSVVFFMGECEFKTPMPDNVMDRGLARYIESWVEQLLTEDQVEEIVQRLRTLKESSGLSKSDHLKSLEERHSSTTQCPRCGAGLVERTAKQGPTLGRPFWVAATTRGAGTPEPHKGRAAAARHPHLTCERPLTYTPATM